MPSEPILPAPGFRSSSRSGGDSSNSHNQPGTSRREFLQVVGIGTAAALSGRRGVMAGPFEASDFETLIPADKELDPAWVKSLWDRGEATVYEGLALERIGMPVGGLCAGQLYLGGDGTLWHWDLFNQPITTGDAHYVHPMRPSSPVDQGFALKVTADGQTQTRVLGSKGFSAVRFRGAYPIGFVSYEDGNVPVRVSLEAFSPFCPLATDDSSLPATVMRFTVTNTSPAPVELELAGWLENAVCHVSGKTNQGTRINRERRDGRMLWLDCAAEPAPVTHALRPPVVFADFEGDSYGGWKAEGKALGSGPSHGAGPAQNLSGFVGKGLVNTWSGSDAPQGKLISPEFHIERPFVNFLIAGGNHPDQTCVDLLSDGRVVRTATGQDSDRLEWTSWDVRDLVGQRAHIEIVDAFSGGWGHVDVDHIEFADAPHTDDTPLEKRADYGTMGLALLEPTERDQLFASIPTSTPEEVFGSAAPDRKPFDQKLVGAVVARRSIAPGQSATLTFAVAWHFPNLSLKSTHLPADVGRHYAARFASAHQVASYLAEHMERLAGQTTLWQRTWYDSTLPYWFLDRTFANTSILATATCLRFRDGRFYGWEGVGCCPGTCTHVWQYAHAVARLFSDLERHTREHVDYNPAIGFDPADGHIRFRAEDDGGPAIDGQAGTILRVYREHQMTADGGFLKRVWPRVKQSIDYLIRKDSNADGVLEGPQHNTLDAEWFGQVPWLSALYVAALRAGEAMAREQGDEDFARRVRTVADRGSENIDRQLWNERFGYYVQRADPAHLAAVGSYNGCHIDQVFGQSWAFQVGLRRILDPGHVRQALQSLWRYNFTPDVGPYRAQHQAGRWYAMAGEAGLIMVTFPRGVAPEFRDHPSAWSAMYFNECMNGFEYQVAGHMLWEGLVTEGLAITRAIHDRYDGSRRNPYNEVECGDHYARSMASYGVYLAACGYEYHGPHGHLGFAPRLTPDHFRCAFTAAEGWGTFEQKREGRKQTESLAVKWGKLRLRSLHFEVPDGFKPTQVVVTIDGKALPSTLNVEGRSVRITLDTSVEKDETLRVEIV